MKSPKAKTVEVTLSQEYVEAVANAIADRMFDLLNDFLITLREELQSIESNMSKIRF